MTASGHCVITDLVTNGLDLLTVAQLSGTSIAMIERHNRLLRTDHAAAALVWASLFITCTSHPRYRLF